MLEYKFYKLKHIVELRKNFIMHSFFFLYRMLNSVPLLIWSHWFVGGSQFEQFKKSTLYVTCNNMGTQGTIYV